MGFNLKQGCQMVMEMLEGGGDTLLKRRHHPFKMISGKTFFSYQLFCIDVYDNE
jgi:hypothetical protein